MPDHLPSEHLFSSVKPLSPDLPAHYFVCLYGVGYGCLGKAMGFLRIVFPVRMWGLLVGQLVSINSDL